jgi:transposase-like protein
MHAVRVIAAISGVNHPSSTEASFRAGRMESMARPRSYPDEFRERAVRLVREWRAERGLSDGGLTVVAAQLGLHRETLRRCVMERGRWRRTAEVLA